MIDNSESGDLVPNNSQMHPGFSAWGSVPGMLPVETIPPALQTAVQAAAATTATQYFDMEDEAEDGTDEEMDEVDDLDDAFDEGALNEGEEANLTASGEPHLVGSLGVTVPTPLPHTQVAALVGQVQPNEYSTSEDDDSDLPEIDQISEAGQTDQQMIQGNERRQYNCSGLLTLAYVAAAEAKKTLIPGPEADVDRFSYDTSPQTRPNFTDLPFNLLQTDEKTIHLFRDIRFDPDANNNKHPRESSHSQVRCHQALDQRMPPDFTHQPQLKRLNMMAQIPELGVVVVGGPVGRVGILTTTRWQARKQSGYRIECILPFRSEEEQGLRPRRALMGMAVGPVQGQEATLPDASPRVGALPPMRFRLLMVHYDHTILSYEIFRPDGEEGLLVV